MLHEGVEEIAPRQIKSKQRVADHGEVLTGEREVNAMLDLVRQETERIDSRFLEPACGTGNFLVEILRRKVEVVDRIYKRSQLEWERNAVLAVSSLYGIEILPDNAQACRDRLLSHFEGWYVVRFKKKTKEMVLRSVRFLLERNIICGDALSLKTSEDEPIVFSEWSPVNGNLLKRRDFIFEHMGHRRFEDASQFATNQKSLFGNDQSSLFERHYHHDVADTGDESLQPKPVQEFPLVHFLEISDAFDG